MTEKDRYTIASIMERNLLNEFRSKRNNDFDIIALTPVDKYDRYDAIIVSGISRETYIVEIKIRNIDYPIGTFNGWIIEKDKYDYLIQQYKTKGLIPIYMNIHKNGLQLYDLRTCNEPKWFTSLLPKNSQDNQLELIEKINGNLSQSEADIFYGNYNLLNAIDIAHNHHKIFFTNNI